MREECGEFNGTLRPAARCNRDRGHTGAHIDMRPGGSLAWGFSLATPDVITSPESPRGRPWGDHDDPEKIVTGTHTIDGDQVTISAREYAALCNAVTERDKLRVRP